MLQFINRGLRCKRFMLQTLIFSALLLGMVLLSPLAQAQDETQLRIFVSVLPQKHFVEQVGKDKVVVESLVQPGFSPELYEPTAQQMAALSRANLYVRIGMPFEEAWLPRIQSINPDIKIVDARERLTMRTLEAHDHEHEGHAEHEQASQDSATEEKVENELDPHVWTSPLNAKLMSEQLRDVFSALRPADAADFAANTAGFVQQLDALDAELKQRFAQALQKQFMVFHPAWGYLADAYGLIQVPIESEGKEPGAKALSALINQAKQANIKTIFVQPQFSEKAAQQVAKAIDGHVLAVNPLAENYIENLRYVSKLIAGEMDVSQPATKP